MADVDAGGTVNASVYSGKEFAVYIGPDAGVGTANTSTGGVDMFRLDVEGVTIPTYAPNQEFEMRSGTGRVAEFGQIFSSTKRVVTEVTLSGRVTLQDLPVMFENVVSQAATDNDNNFKLATGYTPNEITHAASTGGTVYNKTLTIYFAAPTAADSVTLAGCVCTSLTLSADMGTASGRYNYEATFQTGYAPAKGADNMDNAKQLTTSLGSTYMFLSDQTTKDFNIMEYNAGNDDYTSINPIINNLSLTFESPSEMLGAQGTNAEPEVIARAVPEFSITLSANFKYDTQTDKLTEAFKDAGADSYIQMILNNRAVTSNLETPGSNLLALHSGQTFGFIIPKAKLTSCEVSSDDVSSVNFEAKVLDPGSNFVLHLATGATA